MKTESSFRKQILSSENDSKIIVIRLIVGIIFFSEGIQKYLIVSMLGPAYFEEIGFIHPVFWSYLTGAFEMFCSILILSGLLTRLASIPLLIIMITAFVRTKLPILATEGLLTFLHEYRTDFSLTLLLILLIFYGSGKWSFDIKMAPSENS
jgi:putative oxidoreductase